MTPFSHGDESSFPCSVARATEKENTFFSVSSPPTVSSRLLFVYLQEKMSFAATANFFYAVVVVGLLYNVFILYAGASAASHALKSLGK